jgi:4-diphosphocytidyl-2-C-methyl-D-erythritol kinase
MQQKNAVGSGRQFSANGNKIENSTTGAEFSCPEHDQRVSWLDNQTLIVRAAAKINLTLSVGSRRPDGFHAFESLMTTVTLYDDLLIRPCREGVNLTCDEGSIPTGIDNLVYRACTLLAERAEIEPNVDIELVKRIPTQAGLGGGSADAAGTLLGLNELWNLDRPTAELMKMAACLGSDVGFFLNGPLAICSGRGEIVTPVDVPWDFWGLIVKPAAALSTAEVYRKFEPKVGQTFARAEALVKRLPKSKPSDIYPYLENDLESSAFAINGELGDLRRSLEKLLNVPVRLSGSGSALFALFDTRQQAGQALNRVQSLHEELTCWLIKNNAW